MYEYYNVQKVFGCYLLTDMSFQRQALTPCYPLKDKYGNYSTLESAQTACSSDIHCKAVYDEHCDNKDTFHLCPVTATLQSSQNSCVYEKSKYMIVYTNDISVL